MALLTGLSTKPLVLRILCYRQWQAAMQNSKERRTRRGELGSRAVVFGHEGVINGNDLHVNPFLAMSEGLKLRSRRSYVSHNYVNYATLTQMAQKGTSMSSRASAALSTSRPILPKPGAESQD